MRALILASLCGGSVAAAQADTAPSMLPPVTTTAKAVLGPADTVRNLLRSGFYERRATSGAPTKAFVTQDQLRRVQMLSELLRLTGRPFCASNLYVDGVRVTVPDLNGPRRGETRVMKDGVDALLDPWQVAGIELYRPADVPSRFNTTSARACGATLIWTR